MSEPQVWKGKAFSMERVEGKAPGTLIFRFSGPFTARDRFGKLTPFALSNMLDFQAVPDEKPPAVNILDLTAVPYMDSTGLGMIMNHYGKCQTKGVRMIVAGSGPRVLELFNMTKVDTVLTMAATVAEADV